MGRPKKKKTSKDKTANEETVTTPVSSGNEDEIENASNSNSLATPLGHELNEDIIKAGLKNSKSSTPKKPSTPIKASTMQDEDSQESQDSQKCFKRQRSRSRSKVSAKSPDPKRRKSYGSSDSEIVFNSQEGRKRADKSMEEDSKLIIDEGLEGMLENERDYEMEVSFEATGDDFTGSEASSSESDEEDGEVESSDNSSDEESDQERNLNRRIAIANIENKKKVHGEGSKKDMIKQSQSFNSSDPNFANWINSLVTQQLEILKTKSEADKLAKQLKLQKEKLKEVKREKKKQKKEKKKERREKLKKPKKKRHKGEHYDKNKEPEISRKAPDVINSSSDLTMYAPDLNLKNLPKPTNRKESRVNSKHIPTLVKQTKQSNNLPLAKSIIDQISNFIDKMKTSNSDSDGPQRRSSEGYKIPR